MSRKEKALDRLRDKPKDFSWSELTSVMEGFGYEQKTAGGSRRKFIHPLSRAILALHEPHPKPVLKGYQIRDVITHLKEHGLL